MTDKNYRAFHVSNREEECEGVVSLYLLPNDYQAITPFVPGQYVSLKQDGYEPRSFCIANTPDHGMLRLLIKCDAEPMSLANHLYHTAKVGTDLMVSEPQGDFMLTEDDSPVVFMAKDDGIAPVASMLEQISSDMPSRKTHLVYVTDDGTHFPMRKEVNALINQIVESGVAVFYTNPGCSDVPHEGAHIVGTPTVSQLRTVCSNPQAHYYIAGESEFCNDMGQQLREHCTADEKIHKLSL